MILIVGGNGSIGRRYQTILKYLEIPFKVCEIGDQISDFKFDKAIIASPTNMHIEHIGILSRFGVPILCEKPVSKDPAWADYFSGSNNIFVVNNYAYLLNNEKFKGPLSTIFYDFYNTGKDGMVWDCCQLVHLASTYSARIFLNKTSPIWTLNLNGWDVEYKYIEWSYIEMIQDFVRDRHINLWSIARGFEMTKECYELSRRVTGNEALMWNPGAVEFKETAKEDLSDNRSEVSAQMGL